MAVALIALVIVGAVVIIATRRPKYQTDEASQLLAKVGQESQAVSSSWNKITSDLEKFRPVEITDEPSSLSAGIAYSQTAQDDLRGIRSELDSVKAHHMKVDESLRALQKLRLPDWFSQYVDLKMSMLQKDGERAQKAGKLLDNLSLYYAYSQVFIEALIAEAAEEQNLDDGVQKFRDKDYAGARQQFEEAIVRNSEIQKDATDASAMIPFAYLDKVKSNRVEAEQVIRKFLSVLDLVTAGSYSQVDKAFNDANQQYEALKSKRLQPGDLMPENRDWWSSNINSIVSDIRELTTQIADLERQINDLIEKNKG